MHSIGTSDEQGVSRQETWQRTGPGVSSAYLAAQGSGGAQDGTYQYVQPEAAGVQGILVLTGRGEETVQGFGSGERALWPVVGDLGAAVDHVLAEERESLPVEASHGSGLV